MGRGDICGAVGTSFRAKRWLSIDICGMFGITLSWSVHIFALFVIGTKLISHSAVSMALYFGVYVPVAVLALSSLFMAWTTDPGAVPLGARPLTRVRKAAPNSNGGMSDTSSVTSTNTTQRAIRRCHKCQDNYKPPRAHHDSVTGRCIVKFDHYCPWVNNAVGALNHKFFCLFLLYTASACILSLLFLLLRVVHCGYIRDDEEAREKSIEGQIFNHKTFDQPGSQQDSGGRHLETTHFVYPECNNLYDSRLVLALLVVSLVFLVFTCSMGCEQLEAIESGKGKIARMKMRVGQAGTEFEKVTQEFNEMFGGCSPRASWHWFLPTRVEFPGSMRKVVLGYEWDESFPSQAYQEPDVEMAAPGDIEMQPLELAGHVAASKPFVRENSDLSIPESQKSYSARNRKGSRLSDDATSPKIV